MSRKLTSVTAAALRWQVAVSCGLIDGRLTVLQCSTSVSRVNSHMPRKTARADLSMLLLLSTDITAMCYLQFISVFQFHNYLKT